MTASGWLFLSSLILLVISWFLLERTFCIEMQLWVADSNSTAREDDSLALEMGMRIFDADDWRIVTRQTSPEFARRFRYQRTVLALEWLNLIRSKVRRLVHDHRHAVRFDSSIRTVDEVELVAEFLSFEVLTAALWCFVLARGPLHTARLVEWSLESARKLRNIADRVVPDSGAQLDGIVKTNS